MRKCYGLCGVLHLNIFACCTLNYLAVNLLNDVSPTKIAGHFKLEVRLDVSSD